MQSFFKSLVRFYKCFLSPFLGGHCRFYPSCSSYALEAFDRLSWQKALPKVLKRVGSCHPFHSGGYDPVIEVPHE